MYLKINKHFFTLDYLKTKSMFVTPKMFNDSISKLTKKFVYFGLLSTIFKCWTVMMKLFRSIQRFDVCCR